MVCMYDCMRSETRPTCHSRSNSIAAESPAAVEEQARVDLRLYNSMLSVVPQNSITIPLMLHCMKEQVQSIYILVYKPTIQHSILSALYAN